MGRKEETNHPSFGQIRFSRVYGSNRFYGSELKHYNYISFEISGSTKIKELGRERYSSAGNKTIIRGRLTAGQFAEMITSMNSEGIPCTLEYLNGNKIDSLPDDENYKEFNLRKFKERMEEFSKSLEKTQLEAVELVKKKTLSKLDKERIIGSLNYLSTEIKNNIPFFVKEFQEQTDNVVLEAKTEIENALLHKITTLGLKALDVQNDLKLNNNEDISM